MSDRAASSRSWIVVVILAASAAGGCGDDTEDTGDQLAAGASAGRAGMAGTRASGDSGADSAGSGGAAGAAGGGGAAGDAAAGSGGSAAGATAMPVDDGLPTWTGIYTFTFWSCRNESCHGMGLAGVNFATKDAAWETMVNKPANPMYQCAQLEKQRVVPGEPENSLLYLKLDINSPCGQQMPPGGQLPQAAIERVREWIMRGAKND